MYGRGILQNGWLLRLLVLAAFAPLSAAQGQTISSGPPVPESSIVIRPWNYDPARPYDYTSRRGELSAGATATGPRWNRTLWWPGIPHEVVTSESPRLVTTIKRAPALPQNAPSVGREPCVEIAGYSVLGIPLSLYRFGDRGPLTFIFGGIHGNERNSAGLARRLAEHLLAHPDEYRDHRVILLPVANPDGIVKDSRTNARGVDLNRNFAATNWSGGKEGPQFGGRAPLCEPESAAIAKLVEEAAPARIIAIHAIFGGRECNNFDGPAEALAKVMGERNKYPVKKSIGYPTPGSFGTWAGIERQIPVITLELPQGLSDESCWEIQRDALLAAIKAPTS